MRNRILMITAALLFACRPGAAQTPAAPQAPAPAVPFTGTVDVGGLFTTTDGDEARYERYRDTRNGLYSNFSLDREGQSYVFGATASHIGYRDQRYNAELRSRKVNFNFRWTSIPLNYSYIARTPFTTSGTTLSLDDNAQRAVQGPTISTTDGTAVGVPCAPGAPPAACGNPAQATQAKAARSIYNGLATELELRQQRDTADFNLKYAVNRAVDVDARFSTAGRDGLQPWGASFAFNNANEVPKPLDDRTNDLTVGATWANERSSFRLGWDGSWFTNQFSSLVWDNPNFLTDYNNGLLPPNGPYDPNGYSNGNGPAQGRQALPPSNSQNVVSGTGLYKLAGRTTLNGTIQFTSQNQDEALIPWTINPLINTPAVLAAFPHLRELPRSTAQAEAKGINTLIALSSRPQRRINVNVRYRYNERDVQTPTFDATEYVRFDAVPEEIEEGFSEQFDNSRHIFDANVSFTPTGWGTVRAGYGHEAVERHGRGFSDVGENIFRLSYDTYSSRYFTVRTAVDVGRRRGEGFVESGIDYESGPGGTQPTLRYYDEADRDRTRGSVLFTVMPRDTVDAYFQFAGGKDRYLADDSVPVNRPGELFGLHEADVVNWNVGVNYHPSDILSLGANFGQDRYSSLQLSRNANPPPDPSWTDPSRDWTLDNDDKINAFSAYLDLLRAVRSTDIRVAYDYSDSENSFVHGGPRIPALTSLNQFIPLPNVENSWHRMTADLQYFLNERTGLGFGYYFEKLSVTDFNTIDTDGPVGFAPETGDPRIDWLGGLITGYGNRPYTGNTFFVRAIYRF